MILKAEGISRSFFRNGKGTNVFTAVKGTDFTLEAGKITAIIGRSGSGKSTFSNMLAGLLEPSEGRVLLDGEDIYALDDGTRSKLRNEHIGVVPQGQTGLQSLTVLENVLAPAYMYSRTSKADRAHELLKKVDIDELCDVYSNELSGGELRRMAIARALINSPSIIIADEPTGDLDDETTQLVLKLFRGLADSGASVLMVTHEHDALKFADFVYKMDKGVLTECASQAITQPEVTTEL